jgi:hypothetical protein
VNRCGFILLALLAGVILPVRGQTPPVTQLGFQMQPVKASARAAGMAESFVADAFDVGAMYWNPAALAYLQEFSIQLNHSQEQSIKSSDENISLPIRLRRSETIAFGVSVNHVGYVGDQSTVYRAIQFGYNVAYAREIAPALSAGVTLMARWSHSVATERWGSSSLFGLYYNPSPEVSYGVSFGGIGTGIEYFDRIDTLGVDLLGHPSVEHTTVLRDVFSPRYLQIGATLRYPAETHDPDLVLSFANTKVFNQSGLIYKGGVEYYPWGFIALRGGYIFAPDFSYARFGWGFRSKQFHLDFSISPNASSDQAIQISLLVGLWKTVPTR